MLRMHGQSVNDYGKGGTQSIGKPRVRRVHNDGGHTQGLATPVLPTPITF